MQVTLTALTRKQRTSSRTGKPFTSLGIKTQEHGEKWLSGFDNAQTKDWKQGDTVEIEVEQKGDYLNFSVPKSDRPMTDSAAQNALTFKVIPLLERNNAGIQEILLRVEALEERIDKLITSDEPTDISEDSPF